MSAVRHVFAAALVALCVPGCVVGDPTYEVPKPGSLESVSTNKLSLNGLYFYRPVLRLSTSKRLGKETLNGLAPGPVTYNSPGADGLEHTDEGRQLLEYIATCALPEDMALVAESEGATYEFPGLLGLAPDWVGEACDESCQRWVSACLLAHTNALGVEVAISLRGQHRQLSASFEESRAFGFEEAAFYGNLFTDSIDNFGRTQPAAFACTGRGASSGEFSFNLNDRLCGRNAVTCSFFDTGPCYDFFNDPLFSVTCGSEPFFGEGYSDCDGAVQDANGNWINGKYAEVITVHLDSRLPSF